MGLDPTLSKGLLELGQDPDIFSLFENRPIEDLLQKYLEEIERFNPAYGLVGAKNREELVVKHILDSLAPLGIIRRLLETAYAPASGNPALPEPADPVQAKPAVQARPGIADAGSGAGLPGIPLAIALPDVRVTLMERMGRRIGFLQNTQAVLSISNLQIEEGEIEKAPPGRFSLVVFRAFHPLDQKLLKTLGRLLAPGGILGAYKGRRDKIDTELSGLAGIRWEAIPCVVPFLEEERHFVIIRVTH